MQYKYSFKNGLMLRTFLAIMILLMVISAFGLSGNSEDQEIKQNQFLTSVEIREYQGEDLSSIVNFRENSIIHFILH